MVIAGRRLEPLDAGRRRRTTASARSSPTSPTRPTSARLFAEAGHVDIVIANAGAADSAPLARTSLDMWQRDASAVNLTGVFLTLREGVRQLKGASGAG